ncbi:protein IQ-DOMAIN 14-like [Cocos nucifera]|uniref:Protein IQ-DOMAIN 14-like n=1 Tax=Cocos nucifera TaxID=13894 RepID=A0A8K0MXU8_COCNU|nr:protein IQ-DOMAIN 14-like [Cocos nucifera]
MASALVNNVGVSPEGFLDCPTASYSSYGWLSPRISFSRDLADGDRPSPVPAAALEAPSGNPPENPDLVAPAKDLVDFEFRLHDPVAMLPADELFSDGKLVPLQLKSSAAEIRSPELLKSRRRAEIAAGSDPYVFSPKAPRCSSRWRELLGLKKAQNPKADAQKPTGAASKNPNAKSLKHFLHRNTRSPPADSILSLPLLRDSDSESVSISSRLSLSSSSSSGPEHEDLPRLSLDSEKPAAQNPISLSRNTPRLRVARPTSSAATTVGETHPPARVVRTTVRRASDPAAPPPLGLSVDSPRMNPAGKVVFQGLERSSSSPGSFHGGPRVRPRGMERSYSANVRVTPVLNVPVCSLRGSAKSVSVFGFGQLFSAQKKERDGPAGSHSSGRSGSGSGSGAGAKIKAERVSRDECKDPNLGRAFLARKGSPSLVPLKWSQKSSELLVARVQRRCWLVWSSEFFMPW